PEAATKRSVGMISWHQRTRAGSSGAWAGRTPAHGIPLSWLRRHRCASRFKPGSRDFRLGRLSCRLQAPRGAATRSGGSVSIHHLLDWSGHGVRDVYRITVPSLYPGLGPASTLEATLTCGSAAA